MPTGLFGKDMSFGQVPKCHDCGGMTGFATLPSQKRSVEQLIFILVCATRPIVFLYIEETPAVALGLPPEPLL